MKDDDHVCLCFHVSQRKIRKFLERERPAVPSQLSECLGAGTGCGWCRPFLTQLHQQWQASDDVGLSVNPDAYATRRDAYRSRTSDD